MSIPLTVNGITFPYPVQGDSFKWGVPGTGWAQQVTNSALFKNGGLFTLTGAVDFGNLAGLKSISFSGRGAVANSGLFRLSSTDLIVFAGDASLGINVSSGFLTTNTGFEAASVIIAGQNVATTLTAAYGQANTAYGQANLAYGQANAAFSAANSSNLTVGSLLTKTGNTANVNVASAFTWSALHTFNANATVNGTFTVNGTPVASNGTFTATYTDGSGTVTRTAAYEVFGKLVVLYLPAGTISSASSAAFSITGLPTNIRPTTIKVVPAGTAAFELGDVTVTGSVAATINLSPGQLLFTINGSTSWVGDGNKGLQTATNLMYTLD